MSKSPLASVRIENNAYVVQFPYDPMAVNALKMAIPSTARSWDNGRKCWIISADYQRQAQNALGMTFPDIAKQPAVRVTKLLTVHYLGQCKERVPGDVSAMGLLNTGAWGAIFPVDVLTAWFENPGEVTSPAGVLTLYGVLATKNNATDDEIKSAYRRVAKQWHPDINHDPQASEMFLRIKNAYDILSDRKKRSRYDAGLALEATIDKNFDKGSSMRLDSVSQGIYRSPLRCGHILAEGVESLGRFVVSKILGWEDISDAQGRVMVSSWAMGDKEPTICWA